MVDSLSGRVMRGGMWMGSLRAISYVASILRLFVLARVLSPDDFGLVGIGMLAIGAIETLTEGGVTTALIQKRGEIHPLLATVFVAQLARAIAAATVLYLSAPLLAEAFGSPGAADVFRVLALVLLIRGLTNPALIELNRRFAFGRLAALSLAEVVVGLLVAVPVALLTQDIRALLFSIIASQLVRTLGSYVVVRHFILAPLDWQGYRQLFSYGKWIFGSNVLIFMLLHGDDVAVGVLLGATALGLYQVAYRMATLIAVEVTSSISSVAFPAYAAMQTDPERTLRAYGRVLRLTGLVSAPATVLLIGSAPELFPIALGERWLPAVPAFQVLCLYAFLRAVTATLGSLFSAIGRPAVGTLMSAIQLVVVGLAIVPAIMEFDIFGAAMVVTGANLLALLVGLAAGRRMRTIRLRAFADSLWPAIRVAAVLGVLLVFVRVASPQPALLVLFFHFLAALIASPLAVVPIWRAIRRPQTVAS